MLPLPHASSKNSRTSTLAFSSAGTGLPPLQIAHPRILRRADTTEHDATRRAPAHPLKAYSPKCLEGGFSDVRMLFLCRGSHTALVHRHTLQIRLSCVHCVVHLTLRDVVGSLPALLLDRG